MSILSLPANLALFRPIVEHPFLTTLLLGPLSLVAGERRLRRRAERQRARAEQDYQRHLETIPAYTFIARFAESWSTVYVSPQVEQLTGHTLDDWRRDPALWLRLVHPHDRAHLLESMRQAVDTGELATLEFRVVNARGGFAWLQVGGRVQRDTPDGIPVLHGFGVDITERRIAELAAHKLLYFDRVTELPNQRLLDERLEERLREARVCGCTLAVVLVDTAGVRQVGEAHGLAAADALLRAMARRLATCDLHADTIAHIGTDLFALLLPDAGEQAAYDAARKIRRQFEAPFVVGGLSLEIEPAIGIALYPEHGEGGDVLLQRGQAACAASLPRRRPVVYGPACDSYGTRALALVADLRRGLDADELRLVYQPQRSVREGDVRSVEALVRWRHPTRGELLPRDFLGIAEQSGLLRALTHRILDVAVAQARRWRDSGLDLRIAVNVTARDLESGGLDEDVLAALERHQVPASALRLELTEDALVGSAAEGAATLRRLHAAGVHLSLDDFGSGYSSIMHLRALPFSELKIDRSFVHDVGASDQGREIVRFMVDLGHHLGLTVLAEGVENSEDADAVRALGCDAVQGFGIGWPLEADSVEGWLAAHRGGVAVRGMVAPLLATSSETRVTGVPAGMSAAG